MNTLKESPNLNREFVIDKDVPLPTTTRGRRARYPFADMQVGDSFLVTGDKSTTESARSAAYAHTRRNGKAFSARPVAGGMRIWCVKPSSKEAA
jgi:hypothetical protein